MRARRSLGLPLVLLAAAGCGPNAHQGTELLLVASFDPSLGIDQLLVFAQTASNPPSVVIEPGLVPPAPSGPLPSGSSVALLLPEEPPGGFNLVVHGRSGARPVAAGIAAGVAVEPSAITEVVVTLHALACAGTPCVVGQRSCADATHSRVCLDGGSGCGLWSAIQACAGGAACSGGVCGAGCQTGSHLCGDACVSNLDVTHCGGACAPCPTAPNAVALCDGQKCLLACAAGYRMCSGVCVPDGLPCG